MNRKLNIIVNKKKQPKKKKTGVSNMIEAILVCSWLTKFAGDVVSKMVTLLIIVLDMML